jgi:hypothetical protein
MSLKPAGAAWLQAQYKLDRHVLTHNSYIGHNASIDLTSKGNIEQVYKKQYDPGEKPTDNLEFLLKYDDINLDFLKDVMNQIPQPEILAHIEDAPSSKYSRKIGFLYEFLTGQKLNCKKEITGNYVDLLEADRYVTARTVRNTRWRINDNLLGTPRFCPMVRKTKELNRLLQQDIKTKIEELQKAFPPEIFSRATDYLYKKETKSSYEIEREEPTPDRVVRFVSLLMQAGKEAAEQMLQEKRLLELQNAIVDPRFAVSQFRDFQNYIGQSLPNYRDLIHYICPPPEIVQSLMKGIQDTVQKTIGLPAEIRAAILAFGFVFIHPFEDGNGRIHRFLIHDVLTNSGKVPMGTIIPVSAHMVNHRHDYDHILETYSKPLMQFIRYEKKPDGSLIITNPEEVEGYFRYPDLTSQCIYLAKTIHATLSEDMFEELSFLQRYDEAKNELQNIVDMPDKLLSEMLLFLHQNKGAFPKRRRERFAQLTDAEINRMESVFRRVFEIEDSGNN